MLLCSVSFGQNWEVLDYNYSNTMELIATVTVQSEAVESIEVAAFDEDGNVRGVAFNTYDEDFDKYILNMTIHGTDNYELLTFKAYDHNNKVLLFSDTHFDFIINDTQGSWNAPLEMDFYSVHWNESDIVYTETSMTITSIVHIDDVYQDRSYLEVAAFCGSELRGIGRTSYDEYYEKYVAYIFVSGNNNEDISFKLYDHSNENATELISINTVNFITDENLGYDTPISIEFTNPVAKIGDDYFNTLAAAVEAATAGQTITLLKDAEGSGVVINKNVTIDFGGFTYTFTSPAVGSTGTQTQGFQILKDNTVTLQNGTLNVAEAARTDFAMLIQNYADLTITDMTLNGDNLDRYTIKDYDYSYVLSNNSGEVYIGGNTQILANPGAVEGDGHYGVAFDVCKYANYSAPVVTLGENVTVEGKVELTGGELYANAALPIVAKKSFENVTGEVGATEGWGTISTPIANVEIPSNDNHDIYSYDEKNAMWRFYKEGEGVVSPFTEFELGQGYLYANKEDITIELTGTLNVEPVELDITYTPEMGDLAGFNFVGNPFAHNISEAHFTTTNGAQLSNGFYVVSPEGAIVVRPANAVIAPMESVMVQTDNTTKLTINNVVSSASKRSEINNGQLEINVANANYRDVAYVSFNDGKGLNKIAHRNAEIPMVYIPVDGANYAIAMMNQDVTEIPVSFQAATMGQYTIGVEAQDCEYAMMTLVDRFTGIETNLLIEDYTFIAKSNDSAERFIIKLAMDNSNGEANENFAFINNGMMYIYNIEGQGTVSVYDVTGRPVAEYNVATSANISTSDFAAGMYIIRMSDENGVKTQKIVVE